MSFVTLDDFLSPCPQTSYMPHLQSSSDNISMQDYPKMDLVQQAEPCRYETLMGAWIKKRRHINLFCLGSHFKPHLAKSPLVEGVLCTSRDESKRAAAATCSSEDMFGFEPSALKDQAGAEDSAQCTDARRGPSSVSLSSLLIEKVLSRSRRTLNENPPCLTEFGA